MLDYRYKTFSVLANTLNYTKAAKILALSQPTVTKHIQYLEDELDTKLFDYQERKVKLTKEGEYLKQSIEKLDQTIILIKEELTGNKQPLSFNIGVSRTIGEYYIPDYTDLMSEQQKLHVNITVENTSQLLKLLNKRLIDFALISGPVNSDHYESIPFYEDQVLLICSPKHPLANQTVSLDNIFSEKFLFREEGAGINDSINSKLASCHITSNNFKNITRIGNIQLLKDYIKKNDGIGFSYALSVSKELAEKQLSMITLKDFKIIQKFYLLFNKKIKRNEEVQKILSLFLKE
ncbi:LysR family transcriptional regulator [Amphibacillus sp. Q70]|uniref:LysR family transcriptional regulator n=1 Tax=Amphibacillus sp. Q70 TaxID=3453416 RepID=UPI003F84E769